MARRRTSRASSRRGSSLTIGGRKMKITSQKPLHRFISIMIAALIAWAIVHFGILAGLKKEPIQQPQQQRP
jgi:hypothetical protein